MSKIVLGLDIRYHNVTAVVVNSGIKGAWIEDAVSIPLSDPSEIPKSIESVIEHIKKKIDISGLICSIALPPDLMSYRNIQVPFRDEKKITQILPFELDSAIPMSVEDLIIDFHPIKASEKSDHADLFVVGMEKSVLSDYINLLASLNIRPKMIAPGSYSPVICMTHLSETPDQWLFIDVDARKTTVIGVVFGQVSIVRIFPHGLDKTGAPTATSICTGIQQTLAGFEEMSTIDFQPEVVFTTGSGLPHTGFEQEMTQLLDVPVQRANLIQDTQITFKDFPMNQWEAGEMDNALALCLIDIEGIKGLNFCKGPFAQKKIWIEQKQRITRTGILAGVVVLLAFSYFLIDDITIQKEIDRLDKEITETFKTTFPEVNTIVDPIQQMRVKIQELKKNSLMSSGPGDDIRSIDILNQISERLSQDMDVKFTQLVIGDGNVQITGDTDTLSAVDSMKSQLVRATMFKNVTIASANRDQSSNRVRFKLKLDL